MQHDLIVSKSIDIQAGLSQVWDALINPEIIRKYLYGTEAITDWKVGSEIIFQGEYQGQKYHDRGIVLEYIPNEMVSYSYWSGFSGLDDIPENYARVTYRVSDNKNGFITLTWTQKGFATEEGYKHSENGLASLLQQIKAIIEGS